MTLERPKAFLLDLDDTILDDTGSVQECWNEACFACAGEAGLEPGVLLAAIDRSSGWYWSDPDRHRVGRLDLRAARTEVVRLALNELGIGRAGLAERIGGIYHDRRTERIEIFSDAIETIQWLRHSGYKLALLTNGAAGPQRDKIRRFALETYFDPILIEGEVGFGKPDERVYRLALEILRVSAGETWMVGDHPEWDVAQPQRMGICGVWVDRNRKRRRNAAGIKPDHIVQTLSDLRKLVQ